MEVTLTQVLLAREERVRRQQALLQKHKSPIVCFTMNIPGPVKDSPLIRRGFFAGLQILEEQLSGSLLEKTVYTAPTGCEAFLAVAMEAKALKKLCVAAEESCELGRLWDMDVLTEGGKLSREADPRSCIVCHAPGRICAATRAHSVAQLQAAVQTLLVSHFAEQDSRNIGAMAAKALIREVEITPKPGLVDQANRGSHRDMDLPLFRKSACALESYFQSCVRTGIDIREQTPPETFAVLRALGREAEKTMLAATGGVNTHKGAVFTMGLLCGAVGRCWQPDGPYQNTQTVLQTAKAMCGEAVRADFAEIAKKNTGDTPGERLYLTYGLEGIRGQAAKGFPAIEEIALPVLQDCLARGSDANHAGAVTLLHLIEKVEDTNLYHRGGPEGAVFAREAAGALLRENPYPPLEAISALDTVFIEKNLSPGGCADLLAATWFLHTLETKNDAC